MEIRHPRTDRGLTLVEVMIALTVLSVGLLAIISVSLTALKENEINRQLKLGVFDTQSAFEDIEGTPFNEVFNTTYASINSTTPRYPQGDQNVANVLMTSAHLSYERISVYYYKTAADQSTGNALLQTPVELNGVAQPSTLPPTALAATDLANPPDPVWVTLICAWESSPGFTSTYSMPFILVNTLDVQSASGSGP